MANATHKMDWRFLPPWEPVHLKTKWKTGMPWSSMVKARVRFEAMWQGRVSMAHLLCPTVIPGEEKHFPIPLSKTHHAALRPGLVGSPNSLEAWLKEKKTRKFLGLCFKPLTWNICGEAQESTFIGRIQWFRLIFHRGHSNSTFKRWLWCRPDPHF